MANSKVSIAMFTPAQKPRGLARMTFMGLSLRFYADAIIIHNVRVEDRNWELDGSIGYPRRCLSFKVGCSTFDVRSQTLTGLFVWSQRPLKATWPRPFPPTSPPAPHPRRPNWLP